MRATVERQAERELPAVAAALRERNDGQVVLISWTDALRWAEDPDSMMGLTLERLDPNPT